MSLLFNTLYFHARPFLPRRLRVGIRKLVAQRKGHLAHGDWAIDPAAGRTPAGWPGWPEGKRFAVILTHDVESAAGVAQSEALASLEEAEGFRSAFNYVPEGGYNVPPSLRGNLVSRGFEVGIHDLRHDGKLYRSRAAFRRNATRINQHLRDWNACGFRSAFMLHRLDWLHDLDVEYDASTFDVDPFEPQPDGASTIFPFWVPGPATASAGPGLSASRPGYVELPYTLPQDSTLFIYLGQQDIGIWKRKVDWLVERGGMVLLNVHPDYVAFPANNGERSTYPPDLYRELLRYIREKYQGEYWHALPREVARFVRQAYPQGGPRRPRHACMLSYSFFEQDNRVNRYARALAARGDIVDVLSLKPADLDSADSRSDPTGLEHAGIRVHHVQARRRDEKRATDFLFRVLAFCWRASTLLQRLHQTRRFDLIHVHNVPDFIVFAAWYPRLKGARLILDLHDLLPEFYQSKFGISTGSLAFRALLLCERLSCAFADHVIVSNHIWLEKVARRSKAPEHCTAMVNHVDTAPFKALARERGASVGGVLKQAKGKDPSLHPLTSCGQPGGSASCASNNPPRKTLTAVFPGGWYHHQGLSVAVEAAAILREQFPQFRLRLVGDGPERTNLALLIKNLHLESVVSMEPPVPLSRIPEILAEADIGIVPKLAEGFGDEAYSTKIMEFMAAGLPVVASRTRIDQYYFGNGEVHFFESGSPKQMAEALRDVILDERLRENLVARGSKYCDSHGWAENSQRYLALVDLLGHASSDRR